MKEYLMQLKELMLILKIYLDKHGYEVVATLERVAIGELELCETLSSDEKEHAREVFGWVTKVGLLNILAKIQPVLNEPGKFSGELALDKIFGESESAIKLPFAANDIDKRTLARLVVLLVSYIFYDEFHYPQPETGVYDIANNPFEKLKWLYRYWFNQLEVAEKGSGLEALFASQDLSKLSEVPHNFTSVSISCAGDLLAVDVLTPKNTEHLFDDIVDFYSSADIVSANLETTVDKSSPLGRTQALGAPAKMNTSEAMFQKFRSEAKINFFSTATNHAMDWGEEGILATLSVLNDSGAVYSGTAPSQSSQDLAIRFIQANGLCIALLAFTMDLNGYAAPPGKSYLANEVRFNDVNPAPDYSMIERQVAAAKAKGADWIIAYCHWGWEFEMYPHTNIREAAQKIIACGVDTILGNHAHVSQPSELIARPGKQDALVVYSFGDFVSYHPESRNSKLSYIIKFKIAKVTATESVTNGRVLCGLEALPIYIVNQDLGGGSFNCRIVKFYDVLENPDDYGLTELEKSQLPHLRDRVWNEILSPLSSLPQRPVDH
ncbi:MAG: CapA family protein [Kaiparowitsia implicata GSE-PSE-MK54-09C]|nr:CapA family protein [Kaiparowitsia implicata GSE-PSE-MK54-09C]